MLVIWMEQFSTSKIVTVLIMPWPAEVRVKRFICLRNMCTCAAAAILRKRFIA